MIKLTAELNGVKVERDIPVKWEEVKYREMLQLGTGSELTALSIFTGQTEETLAKAKIKNLDGVIRALSFLRTEIPLAQYPKQILGYPVRQDLGFEAFGQYTDIKSEVDKGLEGIELLKQYPLMCAIYVTNPYDFTEAEKKVEEMLNAPCTEVLAVGNFLLMKLIALNRSTDQTSRNRNTRLKNWRLALKGWRKRLEFRVRYFTFNLFHRIERKRT